MVAILRPCNYPGHSQHAESLRKQSLANKLVQANKPDIFWSEIRQINSSKTPLPSSVEGVSGKENIVEM